MTAREKTCRVERSILVVNTNTINTYKNLQMLRCPFAIHLCFPLGTVKPCLVSKNVTSAVPQTVRLSFSNRILNFWATIVIQIFYILSEKFGQQSTLFESLAKHLCIHYPYVGKDSKEPIVIQLYTTPRNSM